MFDNILTLIPINPSFVPDNTAQLDARMFLTRCYPDNQIEFISTDLVEFVDQGSNSGTVSCNLRGQLLDVEFWQDAMDVAFQRGFEDLEFMSPCCKKLTSLNELKYEMPAGFARHRMCVSNPQNKLSNEELAKLEEIVGTKLKLVWAHY